MCKLYRQFLWSSAAVVAACFSATQSFAQSSTTTQGVEDQLNSVNRNTDPFDKNEQVNLGITLGEWIILPQLGVGTSYNDNLYGSHTNVVSGWGVTMQPAVTLKRDTGIQDTTLSLLGNISLYPDVRDVNTYTGTADLTHIYEIERGFTVTLQGDISHLQDALSAFSATGAGGGDNRVYVEPITYMSYSGGLTINKTFNDAFIEGGGNVLDLNYDNAQTTAGTSLPQSYRDLVQYSGHARLGLRFLSDAYVFIRPEVTQYDFGTGGADATGYTIAGGVGTDRLSLFRGELFAGYQSINNNSKSAAGTPSTLNGATFGGKISWTPTRDIIATLSGGRAFTPTTSISGSNESFGSFTRSSTVSGSVTYSYSRRIDLAVNGSYTDARYSLNSRDDAISSVGLSGTYYFLDNVGVKLDYSFTNVDSNQSVYSYTRNMITIGLQVRI